jgi:hypothetical protein
MRIDLGLSLTYRDVAPNPCPCLLIFAPNCDHSIERLVDGLPVLRQIQLRLKTIKCERSNALRNRHGLEELAQPENALSQEDNRRRDNDNDHGDRGNSRIRVEFDIVIYLYRQRGQLRSG